MSPEVRFACLLIALILFILAAVGVSSRINLMAAGLAFWVLVPMWEALEAL